MISPRVSLVENAEVSPKKLISYTVVTREQPVSAPTRIVQEGKVPFVSSRVSVTSSFYATQSGQQELRIGNIGYLEPSYQDIDRLMHIRQWAARCEPLVQPT